MQSQDFSLSAEMPKSSWTFPPTTCTNYLIGMSDIGRMSESANRTGKSGEEEEGENYRSHIISLKKWRDQFKSQLKSNTSTPSNPSTPNALEEGGVCHESEDESVAQGRGSLENPNNFDPPGAKRPRSIPSYATGLTPKRAILQEFPEMEQNLWWKF